MAAPMTSYPNPDKNSRPRLTVFYRNARSNLLLIFIFSLINTLFSIFDASVYFLFSAAFPYYAVEFGYAFSSSLGDPIYYSISLLLAVLSLSLYLLLWILSKKNHKAMLAAAIFFGIDCGILVLLLFFFGGFLQSILDIVFHVFVMISLVRGASAGAQLARMDEDSVLDATVPFAPDDPCANPPYVAPSMPVYPDQAAVLQDSIPLRPVDVDAKARVLIEGNYAGMNVQVRRTHRTTEFVVNNMVYAESTSLLEGCYSWDIQVCRVPFHYETSTTGQQTLSSNGVEFARKLRLY